jgi:GNAT superfamily N-acetyltransferase
MKIITPCTSEEIPTIAEIINESAVAYKGVIPADRWHEPYMPMAELRAEIDRGVRFFGSRADGRLVGVMGIQDVKDVTLIRHAYVRSEYRRHGVGQELLAYLRELTEHPVLIGTWKAAVWAIRFYEKHGFAQVGEAEKNRLLQIYWTIPTRQVEESVVLADERWRRRRG